MERDLLATGDLLFRGEFERLLRVGGDLLRERLRTGERDRLLRLGECDGFRLGDLLCLGDRLRLGDLVRERRLLMGDRENDRLRRRKGDRERRLGRGGERRHCRGRGGDRNLRLGGGERGLGRGGGFFIGRTICTETS